MNKIYRVIWSKTKNCFVVVSEIAKAHSKGGSTVRRVPAVGTVLLTMLLASVLSFGVSAPVWAEPPATGANYYGVNATDTSATNVNGEGAAGAHAIAAGENAKATGEKAISIGYSANANNIENIAEFPTVIPNELYKNIRKFDDSGTPDGTYYDKTSWNNLNDEEKKAALLAELKYRWQEGGEASIAIGDMTFSLKGDVVIGSTAKALGNDAVVIGRGATGFDNSVALGTNSSAAPTAIAIGSEYVIAGDNNNSKAAAHAAANYSIAIGMDTEATQSNAVAIGTGASASGINSAAFGADANASALHAFALGRNSAASGQSSLAAGYNANVLGDYAIALGQNAVAGVAKTGNNNTDKNDQNQIAIGNNARSYAQNTITIGNGANNNTSFSSVAVRQVQNNKIRKSSGTGTWTSADWGKLTDAEKVKELEYELKLRKNDRDSAANPATYRNSITIGEGTNSLGLMDVTIGSNAVAAGERSISIGRTARALENESIAIGYQASTSATLAIALGTYSFAGGQNSISVGEGAQTFKQNTTSVGPGAKAYGYQSSVVGFHSYSVGSESTVFGHDSTAHGNASAVFGYNSTAGAVTLVSGDSTQNWQNAWSRIRAVKEAGQDEQGNTVYQRVGESSAKLNQYEIVTTASGQVVALKRDTAENTGNTAVPEYYKIKEFRTVDNLLNESGAAMSESQRAGYWFVVDTTSTGRITNINSSDYGGQTEGGVAFGDLANAVGNKSLAVGRSTVADGNDSTAIGIFANAYGTGSMAYGQYTSTGTVDLISSQGDRHVTEMKTPSDNASVSVYRRLVNGGSALLNKLNEYVLDDIKDSANNTVAVKMNARGRLVGYWASTPATSDEEYLNPDNWSSVTQIVSVKDKDNHNLTLDTDTNEYYYESGGKRTYLSDTDELAIRFKYSNGDGGTTEKTVTAQAGSLLLSQGGVAMGAYAHAEGDRSMALGRVSGAYAKNSTAIGLYANAVGIDSMAIGDSASAGALVDTALTADGYYTASMQLDEGTPVTSGGIGGIAVGSYAHAVGDRAISVGRASGAYDKNSTAFGLYANAYGEGALTVGHNATAGAQVRINYDSETDTYTTTLVRDGEGETLHRTDIYGNPVTGEVDPKLLSVGGIAIGSFTHADGTKAIALGRASGAYGKNSAAIGLFANSIGEGSLALGHEASAGALVDTALADDGYHTAVVQLDGGDKGSPVASGGVGGIAVGSYAHAVGDRAISVGRASGAYDKNSTAFGLYANAYGEGALTIGHNATAGAQVKTDYDETTDTYTTTLIRDGEGETLHRTDIYGNPVTGEVDPKLLSVGGIAIGSFTHADGTKAIALGRASGAYGMDSTVVGLHSNAYGEGSIAFGHSVTAGDKNKPYDAQVAVLHNNPTMSYDLDGTDDIVDLTRVVGAVAMGSYAEATGRGSLSVGRYSKARSAYSTAMGIRADVEESAENAIAIGREAMVGDLSGRNYDGLNSIAIGTMSSVKGQNSIAIGMADMLAEDGNSIVPVGNRKATTVTGDKSIAIGMNDTVTGNSSIAIGTGHVINGDKSGAFGDPTVINGNSSYAVGNNNTISVNDGFILGNDATVTVEGGVALGTGSHAVTDKGIPGYDPGTDAQSTRTGDPTWESTAAAVSVGGGTVRLYSSEEKEGYTLDEEATDASKKYYKDTTVTRQITNVAAGYQATDAVNVAQLRATRAEVAPGTNVTSVGSTTGEDGQTIYTVNVANLGYKVNDTAAKPVAISEGIRFIGGTGTTAELKTTGDKEAVTFNAQPLTFGGGTGGTFDVVLGNGSAAPVKIVGDGAVTTTTDAVNKTIKVSVDEAAIIANVSLGFAGDDGTVLTKKDGDQMDIVGGKAKADLAVSDNIGVYNDDGKLKINLAKAVTGIESVTVSGYVKAGGTTVNDAGLTITGGPVVTKTSVNMAGNKITNIAEGSADTDAVSVSQLKKAKEEAIGSVKLNFRGESGDTLERGNNETLQIAGDGSNITTKAEDGKIVIELSRNLTVDSVTAGDSVINNDGVTAKSVTTGDTVINTDGLTIANGPSVTKDGIDAGNKKITGVADGTEDSDAVNLGQLRAATTGTKTVVEGGTNIASIERSSGEEGQTIYKINAKGASVSGGSDAVKVTTTEEAGNVTDYAVDLSDKAKEALDKAENEGLTFAGDTGTSNNIKLGEKLSLKGGAKGTLSDGNIGVEADGDTLNIKLAKEIKDVDSIRVNKTVTVGDSTLNTDGLTITNGPSVTKDGIDGGGKRVTNISDGKEDSDAASMGQLRKLADTTGAAITNVSSQISQVDNRMKKGLAGAAALAALHPMDFDPDSKLTFAAGVGNYRGANAGAVGAFYRPDEKVMFSMGGTFGNGENMVNAGISFALDRVSRVSNSRTAMAHEIVELRDHIARQDDQIAKLTALVNKLAGPELAVNNPSMFPDVPENHWAYEYVADLQRRGALEGYPDGQFRGDRPMTRFEFAALLDRALQNGFGLDERAVKEFEPELGRIYVQRISGQDNDRKKIERVRVNNLDKANRDMYGNRIVTAAPAKAASK